MRKRKRDWIIQGLCEKRVNTGAVHGPLWDLPPFVEHYDIHSLSTINNVSITSSFCAYSRSSGTMELYCRSSSAAIDGYSAD
jgi:hypothetical protein